MADPGPISISLILPCWKDFDLATALADEWADHPFIADVIIAGVAGELPPVSRLRRKIKLCHTLPPNRGEQMNNGARIAGGDVLLFHHVDSELTREHLRAVSSIMRDSRHVGGGFYRKFDQRHRFLRHFERLERWHGRAFGTIYGDQSLFVRRHHFVAMGGFAPIPLMEDVEFSKRLRRSGKVTLLDPPMRSAARQQLRHSAWAITIRNALFLVLFHAGVSPWRLHRWYYPTPAETRSAHLHPGPPACSAQ